MAIIESDIPNDSVIVNGVTPKSVAVAIPTEAANMNNPIVVPRIILGMINEVVILSFNNTLLYQCAFLKDYGRLVHN